jgi:hypothetical protein
MRRKTGVTFCDERIPVSHDAMLILSHKS